MHINPLRRQKDPTFDPLDKDTIEAEIHRTVVAKYAQPEQRLPMPDYVEHAPDANEVAKLSSQAIASQYEQTAQEVERMGQALVNEQRNVDEAVLGVVRAAEHYRDTVKDALAAVATSAGMFRDEAAAIFRKIQDASILADNVRRTCGQLREQIEHGKPQTGTEDDAPARQDDEPVPAFLTTKEQS